MAMARLGLALGILICIAGLALGVPEHLALGTLVLGGSYFAFQFLNPDPARLDAVGVYSLFAGAWFGASNLVAYLVAGSSAGDLFWVWQSDEHVALGQTIATTGVVVPVLTNELVHVFRKEPLSPGMPGRTYLFGHGWIVPIGIGMTLVTWAVRISGVDVGRLGGLGDLVKQGGNGAIFLLTSCHIQDRKSLPRGTPVVILLLLASEILWAVLFTFLRVNILWPMAAWALPHILERRVTMRQVAITLMGVSFFATTYEILGMVRTERVVGADRAERIVERWGEVEPEAEVGFGDSRLASAGLRLMARMSTVNQLSQVGKVVDEDGFYDGETIAYFTYVLIPRIVWPDKPVIKPGAWFAERIGRGHYLQGGEFSNAVNITVPGEFYLNFGWPGVLVGMCIFSLLLRLLWDSSRMALSPRNAVGRFIGLLTLQNAMFAGSHAGMLVDLAATYGLLLLLSWGLILVTGRARSTGSDAAPSGTAPARDSPAAAAGGGR